MRQTYRGKHYIRFRKIDATGEEVIKLQTICERYGVESIVRIPLSCRRAIPSGNFLDHFNLINTGNIVGKKYLLCWIVEFGRFKENSVDIPPLLDFGDTMVLEAVEVKQKLKWDDLSSKYFTNSFRHIKNKSQLLQEMLYRYGTSMNFIETEILNMNLAYTRFKFLYG